MMPSLLFLLIGSLVAAAGLPGASACCDTVRFDSTGLLAESENAAIIGTYEYVPDEAGGYYECPENGLYLYYYESRGVSIIPCLKCMFPFKRLREFRFLAPSSRGGEFTQPHT